MQISRKRVYIDCRISSGGAYPLDGETLKTERGTIMYYFKSGVNTGALLNNMYNRRIADQSTFEPFNEYVPHIKAEEAYTAIESEIDNGTISESGKYLIRRLLEAYEKRIDIEYAYFYRLGVWDGYCLGLQDGSAFSKPEFLTEELHHAENSAQ